MKSLYIHIPFCKHKCFYCDFNSYSGKDNLIKEYIEALKKELLFVVNEKSILNNMKKDFNFETVYFGGGTPSNIPAECIKEVMDLINCKGEVTLELNPGTIDEEKLLKYKEAGINRLSIGLQAIQDDILKNIGRIHTLKDFEEAFNLARKIGFSNISVDLMFGLPNQTLKDVKESVDYLIKLGPEHISCYSLILHDELVTKNKNAFNNLPNDDEERKMYYLICDSLCNAGYKQYEISNFSKIGYESKHNLCYWNQDEYYGIGAGASSYINGVRFKNINSIEEYIKSINEENLEDICTRDNLKNDRKKFLERKFREIEEVQEGDAKLKEYMILRLRLLDGVSINDAKEKFKIDILNRFNTEINKMQNLGLLEVDNNANDIRVKLTKKGLDLANIVWEEFI